MDSLTMERFEKATDIVAQVTNETKLLYSPHFSNMTGNKVYLKPENMQYTVFGIFKNKEDARRAYDKAGEKYSGYDVLICQTM